MKLMRNFNNNRGFSLVELLIVCAMMGLVMAAIFTLYQTHQRTAYTQEEVVEVQQNLRIAMDSIARDLRMAGFLVPSGNNPLGAASTLYSITINTGSEAGGYARINEDDFTVNVTAGTDIIFTVDSNDAFSVETTRQVARIIRPVNSTEPVVTTYTVEGVGNTAATCNPKVAPCLVLRPAGGGGTSVTFRKGDIIARTGTTAIEVYPNTIAYSVVTNATVASCPAGQNCIARNANGGGNEIIANNIQAAGLLFSYPLNDNTESFIAVPADWSTVKAVRVTITGQTATTTALSGGVAKTRQITSIVRIRNR